MVEEGNRTETHQRSIPSSTVSSGARVGIGLTRAVKGVQSLSDRLSDVKALSVTGQVSFLVPSPVSLALVHRVKAAALNEALAEAKGHASIIRPL